MLKESDCPPEERVLPLISLYPESKLPSREYIETNFSGRPILSDYADILENYYNWTLGENEVIIYTGYGYCDVSIPKTYDYLIFFKALEKNCRVSATVKFAFFNGRIPMDTIAHGHHTYCVIEFEGGLPEALKHIPNWSQIHHDYRNIGLCDKKDAELIIKKASGSSKKQ